MPEKLFKHLLKSNILLTKKFEVPEQVKKVLLSSCLATLRSLRDSGGTRTKTQNWGACGKRKFQDSWRWPKGNAWLFPSRLGGHIKKDIICHNITKARKSFHPPPGSILLDTDKIRSHSGRHRMVNDLKTSGIPADAAMVFARIKHKRTYDKYGQMDSEQCGRMLQSNKKLKATLKSMYG